MPVIIHINDNNLLIQRGAAWSRSQGYAWLKDGKVHFDLDQQHNAALNCRLEPQQINSRYWQQCEQISIAANDSGMRHAADLIWRHLTDLKSAHKLEEVILVVPSHYQAANLQLLLGIAKSCGIRVSALVNKAVLALQPQIAADGRYLHTDVQLHQTVCSEVVANNGKLKLGKIEILHEVGLQVMQDSLLKAIQDRFILSDRFDPLHYAETEQQLFDQLPQLASQLAKDSKANVSVKHQGRQHGTSIDIKQWNAALEQYQQQLTAVEMDSPTDHFYYDFNGFQALQISGDRITALAQPVIPHQVLHQLALEDKDENLIYRTELPLVTELQESKSGRSEHLTAEPSAAPETASNTEKVSNGFDYSATHLLQAGVAVPITQAQIATEKNQLRLIRGRESNIGQLLATQKIFIMSDINRKQLKIDDRLGSNLADGVITVIRVVQGEDGDPTEA